MNGSRSPQQRKGRFAYEGLDRVIHERARLSVLTSLIAHPRGLRFGGMVQMRDVWSEEIEAVLAAKKSPKDALDAAVSRGNQMLRQFERTASK